MSTLKNKPQYKTEEVRKDDGTIVHVCRVSLKDLDTLLEIQDRLIEHYVEVDGAVGKLMADESVRADLTTMCSLLPIAEKTKTGEVQYLNFEEIQEHWEQLIVLFFNAGLNIETRDLDQIIPSKISQLHFFPYMEIFRTYHNKMMEEKEKEKSK